MAPVSAARALQIPSRVRRLLLSLLILLIAAPELPAADARSGLPIPRFVSLRASKVNLRAGPGKTYPVEWVYQRRNAPVEVIQEFDTWRKIRDWEGTEGWVHQNLLDGTRFVRITAGEEQLLLQDPAAGARPVARLAPGVIARLLRCNGTWCELDAQGYAGWLARDAIWGVYPDETFQ